MSDESLITRFTNERVFVEALQHQILIGGQSEIASEIASVAELQEVSSGEVLIHTSDMGNDIYFILAGGFEVRIKSRAIAQRGAGQHVGEMTLIDPRSTRSANVVSTRESVVAKVSESDFSEIADKYPRLWKGLAVEIASRLRQRDFLIGQRNLKPYLFLVSAAESLPIAREVQAFFEHEEIVCRVWTDKVFGVSTFPLEDLETQLRLADFAVIILGAEDKVISRGTEFHAPRDNTILELGLFMGALTRERTFILKPRGTDIKIPSDLLGLIPLEYNQDSTVDPSSLVAPSCNTLLKRIHQLGPK